jgi:hypothetical protein
MMFLKNTLEGCILKLRSQEVVPSAMALLDFKKENTIKYKVDTSDTDATRVEKTIVLNFTIRLVC